MARILDKIFQIDSNDNLPYVDWEYVESIPEFSILKNCQQNTKYHKEGSAWEHTKRVTEEAIKLCKKYYSNDIEHFIKLAASALFHDIGKGVKTFQGTDGVWHSYGHEEASERITRRLLWDENLIDKEAICSLVKYHMEPLNIFSHKDPLERLVKMAQNLSRNGVSMHDLINLKIADVNGSEMEDEMIKISNLLLLDEVSDLCNKMQILFGMDDAYNPLNDRKRKSEILNKEGLAVKLYMLIGLPGAGKDTYVNTVFEDISAEQKVILCRDDIRAELGYCNEGDKIVGTSEQEQNVTNIFNSRLIEAVKNGKTIIINNLNLKRKYRDSIKELLKNYNVIYEYHYVGANSLDKNIKRRQGQITKEIFNTMIEGFDWPDVSEYDEMRIIIN